MNGAREQNELLAELGCRLRELQAATPAFGYCAGCGAPCALDPDGHALCLDCERTIGKGEPSWSAK